MGGGVPGPRGCEGGGRGSRYRRADVGVLRITPLLYVEGLTLAGANRKLTEEQPVAATDDSAGLEALLGSDARERILNVKQGLRDLAMLLARTPGSAPEEFELRRPTPRPPAKKKKAAAKKVAAKKK